MALNEGRSVNPGYTARDRIRPADCENGALNEGRSVNPGYTVICLRAVRRAEGRSVNPGYTRHRGSIQSRERSTKAGASTPATPFNDMAASADDIALNEGRSVNPGYTRPHRPLPMTRQALNEGRSVNPGYTRPRAPSALASSTARAQRRPERQPRLHPLIAPIIGKRLVRSTKAGASTPATRWRKLRLCRNSEQALNEGRSVNPGYTSCRTIAAVRWLVAQRRPERQPRLHQSPGSAEPWRRQSLNEGRSVNPGYTRC